MATANVRVSLSDGKLDSLGWTDQTAGDASTTPKTKLSAKLKEDVGMAHKRLRSLHSSWRWPSIRAKMSRLGGSAGRKAPTAPSSASDSSFSCSSQDAAAAAAAAAAVPARRRAGRRLFAALRAARYRTPAGGGSEGDIASLASTQFGSAVSWHADESDDDVAPLADADAALAAANEPGDASDDAAARRGIWSVIKPSCAANVLPRHRAAMPSLPAVQASPDYPVVVTPDPSVTGCVYNASPDLTQQLGINSEPIAWDSSYFSGKIQIHINGLASTQPSIFAGKKRTIHIAAQGRFKRPARVAAQCTGQEFAIPIAGGKTVEFITEQILRACAKVFTKTTRVDAHGERPYFLNPLIAATQLFNVSLPGQEPGLWDATEDCRLLSPHLADEFGNPLSSDKRRKWCDEPENLEGLYFNTEHVYTMHLYQHIMDFGTYRINVGPFMSFDLTQAVSAQPLQIMAKDVDTNEYSYCMLIWHEKLLYPEVEEAGRARRAAARRERAGERMRAGADLVRGLWSSRG